VCINVKHDSHLAINIDAISYGQRQRVMHMNVLLLLLFSCREWETST